MTKFTLKPVFALIPSLVLQLPVQIFFSIWLGTFFGGFAPLLLGAKDFSVHPSLVIGGVAFVLTPFVVCYLKKANYAKTEYRFYEDRLEFEEGFLTINKKVVKYKDMKEVTLRRGILQRSVGLGSIYLSTLATGSGGGGNAFGSIFGSGSTAGSGIYLRDIPEPEAEYERVRALVDAATSTKA